MEQWYSSISYVTRPPHGISPLDVIIWTSSSTIGPRELLRQGTPQLMQSQPISTKIRKPRDTQTGGSVQPDSPAPNYISALRDNHHTGSPRSIDLQDVCASCLCRTFLTYNICKPPRLTSNLGYRYTFMIRGLAAQKASRNPWMASRSESMAQPLLALKLKIQILTHVNGGNNW